MAEYATTPQDTDKMPAGIPYIIGNEAAERFSYYGMRTILTVFMFRYLHLMSATILPEMSKAEAQEHYHTFSSWVYFFPIFGAIISDAFTGKYRIIMWVSVLYCIGHLALALMGGPGLTPEQWLWLGLFLIALGSGGIKPCVSAHVGDQFGERNKHYMEQVYQWFYFSINFGSTLSTILTPWLLEWYGPHIAFGVPGVLMAIATLMFWMGRNVFIHVPPAGSVFLKEVFSAKGISTILRLGLVYMVIAVFWALFDQTSSAWVLQAEDMNLRWLGMDWLPSQIQVLNPILVMVMIPLFQFVIYPSVDKVFKMTPLRKISIGLFIITVGFGLSAVVQQWIDAGQRPSIAWQFFAYVIITAAEIMVSITGLEFSYAESPKSMKSVIMAVWLFSVSLGNIVTAGVNHAIQVHGINDVLKVAKELDNAKETDTKVGEWIIQSKPLVDASKWTEQKDGTAVLEVIIAGHDGKHGTDDDIRLTFNRFRNLLDVETAENSQLSAAKEKIDAFFFESNKDDKLKEIPSDEEGAKLIAEIKDTAGREIHYHRITRDRYRLVSDGPDGTSLTPDDVVLTATVQRADPEEAERLKNKPYTWREKRLMELRGEEGERQVKAERGEAPETSIGADFTVGGLSTLEGAGYFWFWTACMFVAALVFIPITFIYGLLAPAKESDDESDAGESNEPPAAEN
ncbi:MAG: MFS transporter [Planctomycetaceae bacterium]|nr:MFS transporter [Planctomycetaceae bacterium]